RQIVAAAAPGTAGDVDARLQVGKAAIDDVVPQLWRIGTGSVGVSGSEFPVAVPLLDASHLELIGTAATRATAEALVESLLMRVVGYFQPGLVQLHVWDVGQFTGSLPGLYPLTRTGLLTVHDPGDLAGLLTELSNRIRRVHTRVLRGGMPSLAQAARTERRTEPWVVAVLLGNRDHLGEEDQRQLQPLPRGEVTAACNAIVDEHERLRTRVGTFRDLLPADAEWGRASSRSGLCAPIGFAEGKPVDLVLADASPHALVGGPSGSGKTNL